MVKICCYFIEINFIENKKDKLNNIAILEAEKMENLTSTILLSLSSKILTNFKIEQKSVDLGRIF